MNSISKTYLKFRLFSFFKSRGFHISTNKKRCFIFLAADYGNLGDVAITFAQKKFLQKLFPEYDIIEVEAGKSLTSIRSIKSQIKPDDIITVIGGGNMGDLYYDIELIRLMVVKTFKRNRVISFPQTIDYSESKEAKWLQKLSQKIYSAHPRLTMMAREKTSFEAMKRLYPNVDIHLTPDIVMTLDERRDSEAREHNAICCIRNDKEKASESDKHKAILDIIGKMGYDIKIRDTHIGGDRYSEDEKYLHLESLWDDFRRSSLVITDRLHGMIFAYITGTPAIVFPNSNFKVMDCYEWIKDCPYIKPYSEIDSLKDIEELIQSSLHYNFLQKQENILNQFNFLKRNLSN